MGGYFFHDAIYIFLYGRGGETWVDSSCVYYTVVRQIVVAIIILFDSGRNKDISLAPDDDLSRASAKRLPVVAAIDGFDAEAGGEVE